LHDTNGKLILSNLTHLQLYTGSSTPLFFLKYDRYAPWITHTWITSIWKYASQIGLTVDIECPWVPKVSRQHDNMLMDLALQYNFLATQLLHINTCRIHLQVPTVSDITTVDGLCLLPNFLSSQCTKDRPRSLNWPDFPRPPAHFWQHWNMFLQNFSRGQRLNQSLGSWVSTRQQWQ
jgi:hypothetical protein